MELEDSLPCLQQPALVPYPDPEAFRPHLPVLGS